MVLSLLPNSVKPALLAESIDASAHRIRLGEAGMLGYYAATEGREGIPLVLLHSINAAASSSEMRTLFSAFPERPVYALDWPGFGLSERGNQRYDPELYADALTSFIRSVVAPDGAAVDLIALSLGSEFAARVAVESRSLVRSLALLSPTGLSETQGPPERLRRFVEALAKSPLAAELCFSLLTTRWGIRHYLKKSFYGALDAELVEQAFVNARAPGARFAPLAFLRGDLFSPNAFFELYQQLKVPTFVLYDRDPYTTFERLPQLTRFNPFVRALRVEPSQGLPHIEQPTQVELALRSFYDSIEVTELIEHRIATIPLPESIANSRAHSHL